MRKFLLATVAAGALLGGGLPALADLITPGTFAGAVAIGGTVNEEKTVLVTAGGMIQGDILFISDTTGSMSGAISTVQSNFASIVAAVAGFGNVAFGAGQYKDMTTAGDPFDYNLDQAITTNVAAVQAAINTWAANGGGDYPEQALTALTDASGAATGWRDGSKRIVVISGDAPAHSGTSAGGGATVLSTAAALTAAPGVTVEAIDVGGLNDSGQFSGPDSIYANGVAGAYAAGFSNLTTEIEDAIGAAFTNYSIVSLALDAASGTCATVSGLGVIGSGTFDRSVDHSFGGALGFTGVTPGTCTMIIDVLVDGGLIGQEFDTITVGTPEPATLALLGFGLAGLGLVRRRIARH
jgi:hypothetical protein